MNFTRIASAAALGNSLLARQIEHAQTYARQRLERARYVRVTLKVETRVYRLETGVDDDGEEFVETREVKVVVTQAAFRRMVGCNVVRAVPCRPREDDRVVTCDSVHLLCG